MFVEVVKRLKREEKSSVNELRKPFYKLPAARTRDSNDISEANSETPVKIDLRQLLLDFTMINVWCCEKFTSFFV